MAGDDARLVRLHRGEEVLIGHQAQALFPRIIGRGEARLVVILAERFLDLLVERVLHLLRIVARQFEREVLHLDVLEPGDPVGELLGQHLAQEIGNRILGRAREHPGGRALQHGDVRRLLRHRRHDGDRGRARSDHHNVLAGVVELLGPELRVEHLTFEFAEIEAGIIGLVVIVIARAEIEEVRGHAGARAVGQLHLDMPARFIVAEIGADDWPG